MIRWIVPALVAVSSAASAQQTSPAISGCPPSGSTTIMMMLQNAGQDFVTKELAAQVATAVVREKYKPPIFEPHNATTTSDEGKFWRVTFENGMQDKDHSPLFLHRLRVDICKVNGAIIDIGK